MKAHLQQPSGLKDLVAFLDILNDQKKYAKMVKELQDLRDQVNEGIDKKMTLDKAQTMESEAASLNARAKKAVEQAEDKAYEIVSDAKQTVKELEARMIGKIEKAEAALTEAVKANDKKHEELNSREAAVSNREAEIQDREDKVSTREVDMAMREKELREKVALMNKTAAEIG